MFRLLDSYSKSILGCALALAMQVAADGAKAATFEVLYTFQGGNDGGNPHGGVIADKAGNLFGTTARGGVTQSGTVFKLAPDGTETLLHAFRGGDGAEPTAGVVADKAGNLYGTTDSGGGGSGTVFKVAPNGAESLLYSFKGGSKGASPWAGLILRNGDLYGTTIFGGGASCFQHTGCGTVFRLTRAGTESVLYSFKGGSDGNGPYAGLVADSAGNFYGTTWQGGACLRCGTVFKLAPDGTKAVLFDFHAYRGKTPFATLIFDSAGNLYGTTYYGGGGGCGSGCGTVFKLAPTGTQTVLYTFTGGGDGGNPAAGVVVDRAGNLYGTTFQGGGSCFDFFGCGTVFKLAPDGTETVLYTFLGGTDGANPYAGLLLRGGYLYGTASDGGVDSADCNNGCGTVFRVKL